jgi:hypothetical protein
MLDLPSHLSAKLSYSAGLAMRLAGLPWAMVLIKKVVDTSCPSLISLALWR